MMYKIKEIKLNTIKGGSHKNASCPLGLAGSILSGSAGGPIGFAAGAVGGALAFCR